LRKLDTGRVSRCNPLSLREPVHSEPGQAAIQVPVEDGVLESHYAIASGLGLVNAARSKADKMPENADSVL
jgi:hypothetical protein